MVHDGMKKKEGKEDGCMTRKYIHTTVITMIIILTKVFLMLSYVILKLRRKVAFKFLCIFSVTPVR